MPAGLQIFNPGGQTVLDLTDRFSKLVTTGKVTIPWNGEAVIYVAGFSAGQEWTVTTTYGAYVLYFDGYFKIRNSSSFSGYQITYSVWRH